MPMPDEIHWLTAFFRLPLSYSFALQAGCRWFEPGTGHGFLKRGHRKARKMRANSSVSGVVREATPLHLELTGPSLTGSTDDHSL
jgi:hypothetical protein